MLGLAGLICIDTLSRVRGSKMAAAGNGVRRMEGELRIVAWKRVSGCVLSATVTREALSAAAALSATAGWVSRMCVG